MILDGTTLFASTNTERKSNLHSAADFPIILDSIIQYALIDLFTVFGLWQFLNVLVVISRMER